MVVKTVKVFRDKKEGVTRNVGDTFTVSGERYKTLSSTKLGALVEEVAEATKSEVTTKPKTPPKKPNKK